MIHSQATMEVLSTLISAQNKDANLDLHDKCQHFQAGYIFRLVRPPSDSAWRALEQPPRMCLDVIVADILDIDMEAVVDVHQSQPWEAFFRHSTA